LMSDRHKPLGESTRRLRGLVEREWRGVTIALMLTQEASPLTLSLTDDEEQYIRHGSMKFLRGVSLV
jgi:hypothetical protein